MKYSSIGNLRDKKGKFTSRKQLADGESISCSSMIIELLTKASSSRNVWCKSFRKINSFGFGIAFSILFLRNIYIYIYIYIYI